MNRLGLGIRTVVFILASSVAYVKSSCYDFMGHDEDVSLAVLCFLDCPADHTKIESLLFPTEGADIFGFTGTYPRDFQGSVGKIIDNGIGQLIH